MAIVHNVKRHALPVGLATLLLAMLMAGGCARQGVRSSATPSPSRTIRPDSLVKEMALDRYTAGAISEESGDLEKAAVEYNIARLFDPSSAEIGLALARVYEAMNERHAALVILEQVRRLKPNDVELERRIAEASLRAGATRSAMDQFGTLEKKGALTVEETIRYSLVLERLGKGDEAYAVILRAIKRNNRSAPLYERLGMLQVARQDFEAADTSLKRLIEIDPSNHRMTFLLGGFSVARNDFRTANEYFRKAVELHPTDSRYWTNLLMTFEELREYDPALGLADSALAEFPEEPQFYDFKARALERTKRYEEALDFAEKSIAIDSTRIAPYLTIGFVNHQLEQWDKSIAAYEKAVAIEADNPIVLNNFAYLLSEANRRLEDALSMVEKALELRPETPSFRDTRGWVLYRLGRFDEALTDVRKALEDEDSNAELYSHLAQVLEALNRSEEARSAWQKAAQLEPDNDHYRDKAR
ncbi:MAG: tetratricopeptide repeat protein [Calditrichaeota bacterium]|nr:tetratricopeptide repeat protein [Calditrichota bacterium]